MDPLFSTGSSEQTNGLQSWKKTHNVHSTNISLGFLRKECNNGLVLANLFDASN